ncbi:MAG TPA: protein kinase [Pyrinomonadaceae bacterium]|jgi:serine/threonine-protein kinase
MPPERWQEVEGLVQAAMERAPDERAAFLAEVCADDDDLRREVESLLLFDGQATGFLETPPHIATAQMFVSEVSAPLVAGRTLGHYRIEREIGRGGMGEIYLALDTRLGRPVALKLLPPSFTLDAERVARFSREARAISLLNHPNIVTIYEIGEAEGLRFIVTEYVEGTTLRQMLSRNLLTRAGALDIAAQTASALVAAHEAGIIHRDIKPENVMVRADGYVKVLDFGLAKMSERAESGGNSNDADSPTVITLNTSPGLVMGTLTYMSPEQARGLKVDARTDVWSLGVVMYEMIAGQPPFEGETPSDCISLILQKEPLPLARYAPDVPTELARIVTRALRKDREERYQTIKDLALDLKSFRQRAEFEAEMKRSGNPVVSGGAATAVHGNGQAINATADIQGERTAEASATYPTNSAEYIVQGIQRHRLAALIALMVFVCAAIGVGLYLRAWRTKVNINSIAVLPFVNQNNDPEMEYRSDGLTESIINSLTQLPNLRVIASSSVFRYKGREADPREVGRELNVQAVLIGRMVQRGETLDISAELVEAKSGVRLWGDRYEAGVGDLLRVQRELADHISGQLRARITGDASQQLSKQYTANSQAYQFYLKGLHAWHKRTADDSRLAVEYFKQAIEKDPDYALAYAALSEGYALLTLYANTPPNVAYPLARRAALKALEKDAQLAEGHAALANVLSDYDWNQSEAEQSFARAIELNPSYATARHRYGLLLAQAGRFDEAISQLKRARELDPASGSIGSALGTVLYYARRLDEAAAVLQQAVKTHPDAGGIHAHLGDVYRLQGKYTEALAEYRQAAKLFGEASAGITSRIAVAYAASGNRTEALRLLEEMRQTQDPDAPYAIAAIYATLGDKEQTLAWLDKSFENHTPTLRRLKVDPQFDLLHSDPRFAEMLRRVGIPL